ncbi:M48 family metallopeptidase [Pseudodesulfovibrio tunisiensis]|uniref:M48 family metallopeptidase n=1 Tax=Pseudodesulfovibrio tunisiensis TaxID=463192 RepID=UPI001FB4E53B|nr:M48 family metallopeptidase [Pseudodesulfovibrio tunisiensis]
MKRTLTAVLLALCIFPLITGGAFAQGIFGPSKLTIRDENRLGKDFDSVIRSQMGIVEDPVITDYVRGVVDRIVRAKAPMPFTIRSAVVAHPAMNAFAIPGGYIYIFTGLIQNVENESQLAAVIAHELGHVSQRHMAKRVEQASTVSKIALVGSLAGLLLGMSGSGESGSALMMGSMGAAQAAMLKYSQDDENEADHVGLNALVKAGYNPEGMPRTFEIMQKNRWFDTRSQMPSYLSTHPGLAERTQYLKDRISRMPETFTDRRDDTTRLKRVQMLCRAKMSDPAQALAYWDTKSPAEFSALDWTGKAIVLDRLKRKEDARKAFETALALDDDDPLILREAGAFFFKLGDNNRAFVLLQKALIKNPKDLMAVFFLARLQAEAGDFPRAISNMNKVLTKVPKDWEVHFYLGRFYGESGDMFHGHLHTAYSALYQRNPKKARYHYQQAEHEAKSEVQKQELKKLDELLKG